MVADTGIFIDYLRAIDKSKTILYRLPDDSELCISSVTLYELYIGANTPEKWKEVQVLMSDLPVLPFDKSISEKSATVFLDLKQKNKLIEFRDIFIGATALVHNLPILTKNTKHFSRIENLSLIDI